MRVAFASSEVQPFSKSGGLADVAGALPKALARLGHEVLVVSPWYATLNARPLWIGDVLAPFDGGFEGVGIGTLEREGVRYVFVGHRDYQRDSLYGYADDVRRFCRFTRAIPQAAERVGFLPDVIHVNDWHTAYLPMVLADGWHLPEGWPGLPSVFTVHNVAFQGESGLAETLWWLRLPASLKGSYMHHFGRANAMQAGLGFATHVTTVSPRYALEVQQPSFGHRLDGTFRHIQDRFTGVLNGIDTEECNPATDVHLPRAYSHEDASAKAASKEALERVLGLRPGRPIVGVVSRFADQKGIDLVLAAADRLLDQGWALALLGSGDPVLEAQAAALAARNPGTVGAHIGFDEALAHLVYAGSDVLAVPSRFEPCGLSQLIAMRYGALPLARDTGGLHDTVQHGVTGFLFEAASASALASAAADALRSYGTTAWDTMRHAAMTQDFGWERSAATYAQLYEHVIASVP